MGCTFSSSSSRAESNQNLSVHFEETSATSYAPPRGVDYFGFSDDARVHSQECSAKNHMPSSHGVQVHSQDSCSSALELSLVDEGFEYYDARIKGGNGYGDTARLHLAGDSCYAEFEIIVIE